MLTKSCLQGYAAKTVFEALQAQACHENMVKVETPVHLYTCTPVHLYT